MNGNAFQNKVAIVTGAGQGIGFEICWQLADQGAHVLLNDVDAALTEEAVAQIRRDTGGSCIAVAGDCSDIPFIKKMVDNSRFGFWQAGYCYCQCGHYACLVIFLPTHPKLFSA
jgi:glucose 1-dehydrogenase